MQDYTDYTELHLHKGIENYEIVTLLNKDNIVDEVFLDLKEIGIIAYGNDLKKDKHERIRINKDGGIISTGPIYKVLKDGTLWYHNEYNNWIINGDKTKHKYLDPLTQEEKNDADKWFRKFKKLYNSSEFVYVDESLGNYYFKIDGEWSFVSNDFKEYAHIDKQYPEKILEPRMIKLKDLTPDFFSSEEREKNKGFMELVGYEETEREKSNQILNPIEYSAGHYIINVHLPKGDTLKIRNFGSMYPNLKTYKIPKEHGGRDDVIFMVQEPDQELYPNQKWGGMYVIRPRKME